MTDSGIRDLSGSISSPDDPLAGTTKFKVNKAMGKDNDWFDEKKNNLEHSTNSVVSQNQSQDLTCRISENSVLVSND